MQTKEYPRDKYGYEIPRCHYVSPINGEDCNDVPMTGEHFCPSHNRRLEAEIRLAAEGRLAVGGAGAYPGEPGAEPWRQRAGGSNRRQPEPPPRIPPNLPRVTVRTHSDVLYFYEDTINHVRQGEMDVRVANCLGNLAMGALATINSTIRAERWAMLDAQRAAEKAERRAAGKKARQEAPTRAVPQEQKEDEAETKEAERKEAKSKADETKAAAKNEPEAAVVVPETAENKIAREARKNEVAAKNEEANRSDHAKKNDAKKNKGALAPVQTVYGFLVRDSDGRKRIIRPVPKRAPESPALITGDVL
jgi:flagellar biosynthesis GTPase FlhF